MKKLTKAQHKGQINLMKARIEAWIIGQKREEEKFNSELRADGFNGELPLSDYMYRFEDEKREDGIPAFSFYFDGHIYDIINGYRQDGFHKKWGQRFEEITKGTGWFNEPDSYSIEYFILSN